MVESQGEAVGYGMFSNAPDLKVASLKQELGEVSTKDGQALDYGKYPIGTVLAFAPFHSCASTHCHPDMALIDPASGKVTSRISRASGW